MASCASAKKPTLPGQGGTPASQHPSAMPLYDVLLMAKGHVARREVMDLVKGVASAGPRAGRRGDQRQVVRESAPRA